MELVQRVFNGAVTEELSRRFDRVCKRNGKRKGAAIGDAVRVYVETEEQRMGLPPIGPEEVY